jgi:hypothetical protein
MNSKIRELQIKLAFQRLQEARQSGGDVVAAEEELFMLQVQRVEVSS